jgi:two-component system, OmpR family, phosphate regulon sensor histidine kinase PhoR
MNPVWVRSLLFLGAVALGTLFVRALSDWSTAFGFATIALALRYLRDAIHLRTLSRWSRQELGATLPRSSGAWEELYAQLYHRGRAMQRELAALNEALTSFRAAAQALPDGVVTLNAHDQIVWCNPQAEQHLNLRLEKDVGQNVANLVRAPDFLDYVSRGEWDRPVQLRMRHPGQGAERILSLHLLPYGDSHKLLLSRDITRFERLETMRRDFVANVSHELKTPLTVLSGFLETITESAVTREQREQYMALMREQAARMQRLVDDLLTLSQLEASNEPRKDAVDTSILFERVEETARQLSAGQHALDFEIEPGLIIIGSDNELMSAFTNLATNAIRYTPAGGTITVRWHRTADGGAAFVVMDTGIGIPQQHLPRLTERFYRVDRSRSRQSGGTGLGLAIVKHVLTRHQGTLGIASEVGRGSTFTATLPRERIVEREPETVANGRERAERPIDEPTERAVAAALAAE